MEHHHLHLAGMGDVAALEALRQTGGTQVQGFLCENQLEPAADLEGAGNLVSRFVSCEGPELFLSVIKSATRPRRKYITEIIKKETTA